MVNDKGRKRLPPYVSYRTFRNFIDVLQQRMPSRIDRSYLAPTLSGSTITQLMASLRFLGLIDDYDRPSNRLKPIVAAKGEQRAQLLREMTDEAFSFVLGGSFDPQSATYAQLEELFHDRYQVTGDLSRKCIKFFIALATDAGITLSPFITKRFRTAHAGSGTKAITKRTSSRTNRNLMIPQNVEEIPVQTSWDRMLLTKFPTFDPNWSDEVKLKWFSAFDELLRRVMGQAAK
jgi:hypothetical protein